jgi:hypothetical protein
MVFPFVTSRNFAFRILVELLSAGYIFLAVNIPKYRPSPSPILITMTLFTAWMGLAVFLSQDPIRSFWSSLERMGGYITALHLFALFIIASCIVDSINAWRRFFAASVIASTMMGAYVSFEYMRNPWVAGTLGNPMYVAAYMLFNVFFTLFILESELRDAQRTTVCKGAVSAVILLIGSFLFLLVAARLQLIGPLFIFGVVTSVGIGGLFFACWGDRSFFLAFLACAFFLQSWVLVLTQVRGAVLGTVFGITIAVILCTDVGTLRNPKKLLGVAFLLLLLVSTVVMFVLFSDMPLAGRIRSISITDKTTLARLLLWQIAWHGFMARPFTGWGPDNFDLAFDAFYDPRMFAVEPWYDRPHNLFLEWLIDTGLPGLCLGVALFIVIVKAFARTTSLGPRGRGIILGLVAAYAFHSFVGLNDLLSSIYFAALAAFAHTLIRGEKPVVNIIMSGRALTGAVPMVMLASIGAYAINAPGMTSAVGVLEASTTSDQKPLTTNLLQFKRVLDDGVLGRLEATQQLLEFAFWIATQPGIPVDLPILQSVYGAAHNAMDQMVRGRPFNPRLEFLFGVFLNRFSQSEEAGVHLRKALALAPNRQNIRLELGVNTYMRTHNYTTALPMLREAYQLDPRNLSARLAFALALYLQGGNATANALLADDIRHVATKDKSASLERYRIYLRDLEIQLAVKPGDEILGKAIAILRDCIESLHAGDMVGREQ